MNPSGQVAVVTGGGSGLGEATARALAAKGAKVAVFDVGKYLLEEEAIRAREMRRAAEARRSMTKFVSTIVIAVLLEALVAVFEAGMESAKDPKYTMGPQRRRLDARGGTENITTGPRLASADDAPRTADGRRPLPGPDGKPVNL